MDTGEVLPDSAAQEADVHVATASKKMCTQTSSEEFEKRLASLRRSENRLNELLCAAEAEVA